MKYIKCMSVDEYIEECGCNCVDVGVEWVYVGVYDDGEDYEESSIVGWVFADGVCMVIGCRMDFRCEFSVMMNSIRNEIDNIEKCYN